MPELIWGLVEDLQAALQAKQHRGSDLETKHLRWLRHPAGIPANAEPKKKKKKQLVQVC